MNVFAVTGIGLALVVLSIWIGVYTSAQWPSSFPTVLPLGDWTVPAWALLAVLILYAAAVLPTPLFVQPTNYLAFYPAYAAIILLLVGALATPFTNISVTMPPGPILFQEIGRASCRERLSVQ